MFVILVYDVTDRKAGKFLKVSKIFGLNSIIIYRVNSPNHSKREVLGTQKDIQEVIMYGRLLIEQKSQGFDRREKIGNTRGGEKGRKKWLFPYLEKCDNIGMEMGIRDHYK